jgi:hypothetical protein
VAVKGDLSMPKLIARLFRRYLARRSPFAVGDGYGGTFFVRYDLIKTRWGSLYLHEFFRSDTDRCLHDHPWPFTTLIVRGGYFEETFHYRPQDGGPFVCVGSDDERCALSDTFKVWRPVGYLGRYPAAHAHRIELDPTKPLPWSLVWVGRKVRPWGFWSPLGWRAWAAGEPNPVCEEAGS